MSAFWERGSPDLPACGPRRGSTSGPVRPVFVSQTLKTLARDQASRGGRCKTSSRVASPGRLAREAERSRQRVPREVPMTQAMTTKARRAPARAVSSFTLWCKGGKCRRGVPRHQAKVSISVQQDQDQQDGRTEVIVEPKTASSPAPLTGKDHL